MEPNPLPLIKESLEENNEEAMEILDMDSDSNNKEGQEVMSKKEKEKKLLKWQIWEKGYERWLASHGDGDIDYENQDDVVAETAEAPPNLIMPLLRYQKEWLAWALQQEELTRGGILADEMGMGKTIQAITLVLAKQEYNRAVDGVSSASSSSSGLPEVKATLVICPLVAVIHWANEIGRFTLNGSNKVLVYHGAKRGKILHEFSDYDFVITTYSIVEAEFRKYFLMLRKMCLRCGKLFSVRGISNDQNYCCGKNASASDSEGLGDRNSNLHSIKWNRIILDEAHYIKDRRGKTTKAVLALDSTYKWALTGTPLHNGVGDLYSLIRFLRIIPYSYFFCKDCDCRTLNYNRYEIQCSNCPHTHGRHFCWWDRYIAAPINWEGGMEPRRDAMILLKHKIFKSILLRRTKEGRSADLALPPKMVLLRRDSLDTKEEDYYTSLYKESQAQFNTYVTEGTVMNKYAHIFELITCLRQAVDHPYLLVYSKTAMSRNTSVVNANGEVICGLCHELVEDPVVNTCEHMFCKACLIDFSASAAQVSCPTCQRPLTADFSTKKDEADEDTNTTVKGFKPSSIINRIRLDEFQTSTKIDALREEIRLMVERDVSAKGIVFSQFTSFLDLIRYSLQKSGVECVQLDGSMSMKAKDTAIKRFTDDPDCRLFLISLKAGGVALNLTAASHVFLMDPWWNPAVERQAQDRIHRIGQNKPVRVVRFIIEGTIEEKILKLQKEKELVLEGTVGGSANALGRLTEADMKFLFVT